MNQTPKSNLQLSDAQLPNAQLTIARADDWHVHLRDDYFLPLTVAHTAGQFARAMVMPNLSPPITTAALARDYRARIIAAAPRGADFTPLMSLYLTDNTGRREVQDAAAEPFIVGFKLYPSGATTNSDRGVTQLKSIMPALEAVAEHELVLQVHGEIADPNVDVFDREAVFIDQVLAPLARELPQLKIVLEHITTEQGVDFARQSGPAVAATITAHHLLLNRGAMFARGLRPHLYCRPVLKRERHRRALLNAATGGDPSFFLGTDSAPHARADKESDCGCAGIYSAPAALELYAEAFESMRALDKLEGFASRHGADFYGLDYNRGTITLRKTPRTMARSYAAGRDEIVPLRAGESVDWSVD